MDRIYLIGYMGSGKTTLGKAFAEKYNLKFIDLDDYIEEIYKQTINQLFAEYGESGFRKIEQEVLKKVTKIDNCIIATGGGAPCFYDNISLMNKTGKTVYLKTSIEVLFNRLSIAKSKRPIIKEMGDNQLRLFISKALKKREEYYQQATLHLNSDKLESVEQIDETIEQLNKLLKLDRS